MYAKNSVLFVTEIGQSNNGLQCVTDHMQCCQNLPYRAGEWIYPNGTRVLSQYYGLEFYRIRDNNGSVILNRVNSTTMSLSGRFCCMLPDARGFEQALCANIRESLYLHGFIN